jgi:two-component system, OmpR family, alkaline phosphatase synthesis response regulator PhoP
MTESILVIEDDAGLRFSLQLALRAERYEVRVAKDGLEGLDAALASKPTLVLLDVMLPQMNGFEVLEQLRKHDAELPILLLTARDSEEDRVRGLRLGADDYVVKPFGMPELLARIGAALRRTRRQQKTTEQFSFGSASVDFATYVLVEMTSLEFKVLRFLIDHAGRVVSRERILAEVWGADYFGSARTVDNFVARLRAKLDPEAAHLVTVRGGGYRFVRNA